MVDQRALDKATAALAGYIRRNPPLQFHNKHTGKVDAIISDLHAMACIEAYEAAKWRPISEARRDVPVLVCLVDTRDEVYIATRDDDWRFDTYDDELVMTHQDLMDRGAMFMELPSPPPQDAASQATNTPPAAEAVS